MDYIQLLQKRINSISESNIESMLFEEFFNLEDKIADLNLKQIERSKGFDDKEWEKYIVKQFGFKEGTLNGKSSNSNDKKIYQEIICSLTVKNGE